MLPYMTLGNKPTKTPKIERSKIKEKYVLKVDVTFNVACSDVNVNRDI
jgi:hypothetical protein